MGPSVDGARALADTLKHTSSADERAELLMALATVPVGEVRASLYTLLLLCLTLPWADASEAQYMQL